MAVAPAGRARAGRRSRAGLQRVQRREQLGVAQVAVLRAPLQPVVAGQQAAPVRGDHRRLELDEEQVEVARVLAQVGQAPALGAA